MVSRKHLKVGTEGCGGALMRPGCGWAQLGGGESSLDGLMISAAQLVLHQASCQGPHLIPSSPVLPMMSRPCSWNAVTHTSPVWSVSCSK